MKKTESGRVVYNRKKHELKLKDAVRMLERLSITQTTEELAENPYMCQAAFEIVRTAFYPTWQRAVYGNVTEEQRYFYDVIEPQLRVQWKNQTQEFIREIGKDLEIPENVINFVLKYFYDIIWDTIWRITDPFFRGSPVQ